METEAADTAKYKKHDRWARFMAVFLVEKGLIVTPPPDYLDELHKCLCAALDRVDR